MNINEMVVEFLFNEESKTQLCKALNDSVDIPIISEKTEAKVIDAVWDVIEEVFKKELLK